MRRHPHHAPGRERCQNICGCKCFQCCKACNVMMVCGGGQSPSSPKGLTWHAAQHTNDGSRQCTCVPQAILFLHKLIPGKNCRRHAIYPTGVIQEGVKNLLLWKRHTQRKLATSMGVLKTTVHCWIVGSTICVHCS